MWQWLLGELASASVNLASGAEEGEPTVESERTAVR
jgi:hypothetical protein